MLDVMRRTALILLCLTLASCQKPASRSYLDGVRKHNDPATLNLEPAYNDYARRTILPDGTETGVIQFKDGSSAKYWFRSHHRSEGIGTTLFAMSDGSERFMSGYFCCEVQLPETQLASLDELRAFISKTDGERP
jgi:hypothetical protein